MKNTLFNNRIKKRRNLINQIKINLINVKVDLTKFFIIGEFDEIVIEKKGEIVDFNEDRIM
jgi:hypothetical protein